MNSPSYVKPSWSSFFSSLAMAENAAAFHCRFIAEGFEKLGETELAKLYRQFQEEEVGHYNLVKSLVDGDFSITDKAKAVYEGQYMRDGSIVERLAVVHLAFEPSALAFLGHIYVNTDKYFDDPVQAEKVKNSFGLILKEEVNHIYTGKDLILKLLAKSDEKTKANVKRSLRFHKAFLSLGLKSFFKDNQDSHDFINSMLENYQMRYETLSREIA